jgi:RNA polymerase sigma factor (sigma-70 family)
MHCCSMGLRDRPRRTALTDVAPGARETNRLGLAELVARARTGDQRAWVGLVERLERLVWKTVNAATSDAEVRKDAAAATWLRLTENLHAIREPDRLPGWLVTTARNEVTAHFRRNRLILDAAPTHVEPPSTDAGPAERVEDAALRVALRAGFARLSPDCQQLLSLLVLADPPLSYAEVEAEMQRPHGSLGPTRARCLDRLRATPELRAFIAGDDR